MSTKLYTASVLLLFTLAQCGEAQRTELTNPLVCSDTCKKTNNVYKYVKGQDYVYEITSSHEQIHPTGESVTLTLKSIARVQVLSDCEFALKVEISEIKDIQGNKEIDRQSELQSVKTKLEGQPLRFGWDDGKITSICPARNDELSALNFKRGILSLLQITMDDLQTPIYKLERDVAGDCLTEYRTESKRFNTAELTKNKNIAGCSKRYKYTSSAEGKESDPAQEQSQAPFVNGEQSCTLVVNTNGPLQSVTCNESHWVKLPLRDQSPVISIASSLRLLRTETSSKFRTDANYKSNVLFEQPNDLPSLYEDLTNTKAVTLLQMVENVAGSSNTEIAAQGFLKIVHSIRQMSKSELGLAATRANGASFSKNARDVFYSALAMTQTEDSVNFLVDYLLGSSDHAQSLVNSVLMSSVFISEPTEAMIGSIQKLLKKEAYHGPALLTISTLARKFCNSRPGCFENEVISNLYNQLKNDLRDSCQASKTKAVMYIKALGNFGSSVDVNELLNTFTKCIKSSGNDVGVEVAVHEALRSFSCDESVNTYLVEFYLQKDRTTESRIKAYESLMNCASESNIDLIVNSLNQDDNQQVGSFVWSHLTALLDSTDPFKSTVRARLQKLQKDLLSLEKNFNLDFRTHSKYNEREFNLFQEVNGRMENSIIFGENSFIPQHTRINVTLTMYGRSINIFDVGFTTVGLDEAFIQMRDYLLRTQEKDVEKKVAHSGLSSAKVNDMKFKSKVPPSIAVSIKVFGHEVTFQQNILESINSADLLAQIRQLFSGKQVDLSLKRNCLLSESILTLPTMSGLPLHMQLSAATSIDLTLSTEVQKTPHIKFETKFVPKVSVYAVSRFFIDAVTTKVGFFAESGAHTNISLGAGAEYKNGDLQTEGLRWRLFVSPVAQKQSIISVKHDIIQYRDGRKPSGQSVVPVRVQSQKSACMGETIYSYLGVKACVTYLPSSANEKKTAFAYEVSVEKFAGYVLHLEYLASKGVQILPKKLVIKLGLETYSPRLVYLNFTNLSVGSSSNYALDIKIPAVGNYAIKATSDKKNIFKGTLSKDNRQFAQLIGFSNPKKLRWTFKEGNKDSIIFEIEKGAKDKIITLETKLRFPTTLKYVYNGEANNVKSYTRGRHAVTLKLPNHNEFIFGVSATEDQEEDKRTLSAMWKNKEGTILDYNGEYTLTSKVAKSVDQPDVQGKLYRFELSHKLKGLMNQWPKQWSFATSGSVFVSKALYDPSEYAESRVVETYFNIIYPKAKNQDTKYAFVLRMDRPESTRGNYTLQSIASFPNSNGTIRRKFQLAWRTADVKDSEFVLQLLSEKPGSQGLNDINILAYHRTQFPHLVKTKLKFKAFRSHYALKGELQNLNSHSLTLEVNDAKYEIQTKIDASSGTAIVLKQDILINKVVIGKAQTRIEYQKKFLYEMNYNSLIDKTAVSVLVQAQPYKLLKTKFLYRDEGNYYRFELDNVMNLRPISIGNMMSVVSTLKMSLQLNENQSPYVYERKLEFLSPNHLFYFGIDVTSPSRKTDSFLFYVTHGFSENKFSLKHQSLGKIEYAMVSLPTNRQSVICPTAIVNDQQLDVDISLTLFQYPFIYGLKKTIQRDSGCGKMFYVAKGQYTYGGGVWSEFGYKFNYEKLTEGRQTTFKAGASLTHDQLTKSYNWEELKLSVEANHHQFGLFQSKIQFNIVAADKKSSHNHELNVNFNRQLKIASASFVTSCPYINLQTNISLTMLPDEVKVLTQANWKYDNQFNYVSTVLQGSRQNSTIFLDVKTSYSALKKLFIKLRSRSNQKGIIFTTDFATGTKTFNTYLEASGELVRFTWDSTLFSLRRGNFLYELKTGSERQMTVKGEISNKDLKVVSQFLLNTERTLDWNRFKIDFSFVNNLLWKMSDSFSVTRQPGQPVRFNLNFNIPEKLTLIIRDGLFSREVSNGGVTNIKYSYVLEIRDISSPFVYEEQGELVYSNYPSYVSLKTKLDNVRVTEFLLDTDTKSFRLFMDPTKNTSPESIIELAVSLPVSEVDESTLEATIQVLQYIKKSTLRLDYFNGLPTGKTTNRPSGGSPSSLYISMDINTKYENMKRFNIYLTVASQRDGMKTQLYHNIDATAWFPNPMKGEYIASWKMTGSSADLDLSSNGQKKYNFNTNWNAKELKVNIANLQSATLPLKFEMKHSGWVPNDFSLQIKGLLDFKGDWDGRKGSVQFSYNNLGNLKIDFSTPSPVDYILKVRLDSVRSDLQLIANVSVNFLAREGEKLGVKFQTFSSTRYAKWDCQSCVLRVNWESRQDYYVTDIQVLSNGMERFRMQENWNLISRKTYNYVYKFELKYPSLVHFSIFSEHFMGQNATLKIDIPSLDALFDISSNYESGKSSIHFKGAGLKLEVAHNLILLLRALLTGQQDLFPTSVKYFIKINNAFVELGRINSYTSERIFLGEIFHPRMGKITSRLGHRITPNSADIALNFTTPWSGVKRLDLTFNGLTLSVKKVIEARYSLESYGKNFESGAKLTLYPEELDSELDISHKGSLSVEGSFKIKTFVFSHSLEIIDVEFNELKSRSSSICSPMSLIHAQIGQCQFQEDNGKRLRLIRIEGTFSYFGVEVAWNKNDFGVLGYEFRRTFDYSTVTHHFYSPVRNVTFSMSTSNRNSYVFGIKTDHRRDVEKKAEFQWESFIDMNPQERQLRVRFTSTMLKKPLLFTLTRANEESTAVLGTATIQFEGDSKAFFVATLQMISTTEYPFGVNLLVDLNQKTWNNTLLMRYESFKLALILVNPEETATYEIAYIPMEYTLIKADKHFKLEVKTTEEDFVSKVQTSIVYQPNDQTIDILVEHGSNPLKYTYQVTCKTADIRLNIRSVSQKAIRGDLIRTVNGERIQDASLSINLQKDNFLKTNIEWRKGIWRDYQTMLLNSIEPTKLKRIYEYYVNLVQEKRGKFLSQFGKPFVDAMNIGSIIDYVKGVLNDMDELCAIMTRLYEADTFYLKTIFQNFSNFKLFNVSEAFSSGMDATGEGLKQFGESVEEFLIAVYAITEEVVKSFDTKMAERCLTKIVTFIRDTREFISKTFRAVLFVLEEAVTQAHSESLNFIDFLQKQVQLSIPNDLRNYVVGLFKRLSGMLMKFDDPTVKRWFQEQLKNGLNLKKEIEILISDVRNLYDSVWGNTTNKVAPRNLDLSAREILLLFAQGKYYQAYDALFKPDATRIELDLAKGQISMVAYVSPAFGDLAKRVKAYYTYMPRQFFRAANKDRRMIPKYYYYLDYVAQRYQSYGDVLTYFPPYPKSAWITQNLQYVSFDGTAGYLHNKCQVTLVKDIRGNRYTLNFIPDESKSTLDIIIAKKFYQLHSSGKFNNQLRVEQPLPYSDELVQARREGKVVRVILAGGLQVELYTTSGMWHISAPGDLHANFDGLLGSNNYHSNDDYQLANGSLAFNNADRVNSWASRTCTSATSRSEFPKDRSIKTPRDEQCSQLFDNPLSHLGRCYFAVHPKPYHQICRYPAASRIGTDYICNLERTYVAACLASSVNVRVRKECVQCKGVYKEGDTIPTSSIPRKDRFIFIVEDSGCVVERRDFVSKIADGLSSRSEETDFHLLQFNENKIQTVTMQNGQITGNVMQLRSSLFRLLSGHKQKCSNSSAALEAIYEAINLPTPSGYRDHLIMFTSSRCPFDNEYSFARMSSLLNSNGIAFHYITKSNFNDLNVKNIVGMDKNTIYRLTSSGISEQKREKDMRLQQDACAALALESDGSIWSMHDTKIHQQLLTPMNRRIKWFRPLRNHRQTCLCRSDKFGNAEEECRHPVAL